MSMILLALIFCINSSYFNEVLGLASELLCLTIYFFYQFKLDIYDDKTFITSAFVCLLIILSLFYITRWGRELITALTKKERQVSSLLNELCSAADEISVMCVEKAKLETLAAQGKIDGLTSILNSAGCWKETEKLISSIPVGQRDALIIIDIDLFKEINDTLGHFEGDQVLIKTAEALSSSFRSQDVVGRLGGRRISCIYARGRRRLLS